MRAAACGSASRGTSGKKPSKIACANVVGGQDGVQRAADHLPAAAHDRDRVTWPAASGRAASPWLPARLRQHAVLGGVEPAGARQCQRLHRPAIVQTGFGIGIEVRRGIACFRQIVNCLLPELSSQIVLADDGVKFAQALGEDRFQRFSNLTMKFLAARR